jgi:hypothetical protein
MKMRAKGVPEGEIQNGVANMRRDPAIQMIALKEALAAVHGEGGVRQFLALDRATQERYLWIVLTTPPSSGLPEAPSGLARQKSTPAEIAVAVGATQTAKKSTPAERSAGGEMKGATPAVEKSTSAERAAALKTSLMLAGDTVANTPTPAEAAGTSSKLARNNYFFVLEPSEVGLNPSGTEILIGGKSWREGATHAMDAWLAGHTLKPVVVASLEKDPGGAGCFLYVMYKDGLVYPNGDGKVRPSQYGGNDQMDFFLCYTTFMTGWKCPYGKKCRYRHDPLKYREVLKILQLGGVRFVETYLSLYCQGGVPKLTGIPLPPAAPQQESVKKALEEKNKEYVTVSGDSE